MSKFIITLRRNEKATIGTEILLCNCGEMHGKHASPISCDLSIETSIAKPRLDTEDLGIIRGMLMLSTPNGGKIFVGDHTIITLLSGYEEGYIYSGVRLGIRAPRHIQILRGKLGKPGKLL